MAADGAEYIQRYSAMNSSMNSGSQMPPDQIKARQTPTGYDVCGVDMDRFRAEHERVEDLRAERNLIKKQV